MNILYTCAPCKSHLDWGGTREMLDVLVQKGHTVYIASSYSVAHIDLAFNPIVISGGEITPRVSGESIRALLDRHREKVFFNINYAISAHNTISRELDGKTIDLVISDSFVRHGATFAKSRNVPFVCMVPEKKKTPQIILEKDREIAHRMHDALYQETGIRLAVDDSSPLSIASEVANLHFTTPNFWQSGDYKNEYFFGAKSVCSEKKDLISRGNPRMYFSTGTLFWDQSQVDTVVEAAKIVGIDLILSTSNGLISAQGNHVEVREFVNELSVMPTCDGVICQAGLGTVIKAIRSGTPVLAIPLFHGNYRQSEAIVRSGAGIHIPLAEQNSQSIAKAMRLVLETPFYRLKMKELQQEFSNLGGSNASALFLEKLGTKSVI